MTGTFPFWLSKAAEAIRGLAARPGTLFALILAMNAIGRPCAFSAHDARLYSLQALNQAEDGAYADDLFLSYGSQDQFSLFSHIVGPAVALIGLRATFFLLYLVFNTLFVLGLFRLVRALIDDTVISTLSLIYLVTAPLFYGGGDIFMVHEQFFTPRTAGSAFTLFALERLLRQRYLSAMLLLAAGLSVHPLMTFGGVLIWVGCAACRWLSPRLVLGGCIAATLAGMAILCTPALATSLFGAIDDEWHQMIRLSVGYNYPDSWALKDWIVICVSFAAPIVASVWFYRDDPVRRQFLLVVAGAGVVGFLTTFVASLSPYALLFQGQPYRVIWILRVLQVPLGFLVIANSAQADTVVKRIPALALVGFVCVTHGVHLELQIIALMIAASLVFFWLRRETAERSEDWWYALARGLVLGAIAWMAFRWWFFLSQRETFLRFYDLTEWMLFDLVGPMAWIVGFCLASAWWAQAESRMRTLSWAAVGIAVIVPIALFAAEATPSFREKHTRLGGDMALVRDFVAQHHDGTGKHPSIYASFGRPDLLWIDVKATSYFDILQTAGVMFHRRTGEEIQRRVLLVNKFEMARQRQEEIFANDAKKSGMENLFRMKWDDPEPTQDDLARLCADPGLDFVVIPQEFPGLFSASNGRIYVYECQKVRTKFGFTFSARERLASAKREPRD